jgi:hypothetical protein
MKVLLGLGLTLISVIATWAIEKRSFPRRDHPPGTLTAFSIGTIRRTVLYSPYLWLFLLLIWGGICARGKWW